MQHLAFEFETEAQCREVVQKLWGTMGVSGEMVIRQLPNGRWRIELTTEKDMRENSLEKFSSYRVEAGD